MNEFDEKTGFDSAPEDNTPGENKTEQPAQGANEEKAEENTTYHYSYKNNASEQGGNTQQNAAGGQNGYSRPNYGYNQPNYGYNGGQYNPYGSYYAPPYGGAQPNYQNPQQSAPNAGANYAELGKKSEKTAGGKKPKSPKGKSTTVKVLAVILAVCIVIAGVGLGISLTKGSGNSSNGAEDTTNSSAQVETQGQAQVSTVDGSGNYTVAGIAEKCMDSCVGITVYTEVSSYNYFYNYGSNSSDDSAEQASGEGSGILMLEDNGLTYIMTCAHVISDGSSFVVTLNDGTEYDATLVAYDSQTDIGVLSIKATGLSIAEFADSSTCAVGEQVVAIGCPGGLEFMNSVTSGYISALDRPVSSSIGYDTECIQTDAAINPGNSGGALFNMQGQVIGVNSSKIASTEYEGMGFAVPSNTAVSTANSLIKAGYVEGRAKIGITYTNIESYSNSSTIISALEKLGFKDATGTMVINEISSESDLSGKDVQQYDMIVAVNGETLTSTDVMTSVLADSSPGDTVKLTIARIENNSIDTFEVECTLIESKG